MTTPHEAVVVLSRALDQAGDVLAGVNPDQLSAPTPCNDWTVEQLIAHLLAAPGNFVTMAVGRRARLVRGTTTGAGGLGRQPSAPRPTT